MEIAVRELSGHLLLATLAASRGHQVLIGTSNDFELYKRMKLLPPGAYVVKNMNIPLRSEEMYNSFINQGFDLYCHEVEPSILWSNFETFLKEYCITADQVLPFKGVFCWGERDHREYTKLFNRKHDIFHITGSPRADLWSPKLNEFWQRDYIQTMKPYVLFASNNSWAVGKRHWSKFLAIQRELELLNNEENEKNLYKALQKDILMVETVVFSLREIASKYNELNFIIRPHPMDNVDYWADVVGEYDNIHVIYKESISPWIAGATVLIHNSCTSAVEAAVQGVPVISYVPSEMSDVLDIANNCGIRVNNHQKLISAVQHILNENSEHQMSHDSHALLDPLLAIDNELASLKIIRVIEKSSASLAPNKIEDYRFLAITMLRQAKTVYDKARKIDMSNKNQEFDKAEVKKNVKNISNLLGVSCPKVRFALNTTVLIG